MALARKKAILVKAIFVIPNLFPPAEAGGYSL